MEDGYIYVLWHESVWLANCSLERELIGVFTTFKDAIDMQDKYRNKLAKLLTDGKRIISQRDDFVIEQLVPGKDYLEWLDSKFI